MNAVTINRKLMTRLKKGDIKERCGLIVGGKVLELKNIHLDPARGFRIDPTELIKHIGQATATWHTHPESDPELSDEDYAGFSQWPQLVHHIIGVRDGVKAVESYHVIDGLVVKK